MALYEIDHQLAKNAGKINDLIDDLDKAVSGDIANQIQGVVKSAGGVFEQFSVDSSLSPKSQ